MRTIPTLLLSATAALLVAGAHAQTLSWTTDTGSSANTGPGTDVTATEFTVSRAVDATHLGFYDDTFASPDGLAASHDVGLWNVQTQQLIASATVPAGTAAPKINNFRVVALPAPVRLTPGVTYVVGAVTGGGDPTRNTSVSSGSLIPSSAFTPGRWVAAFTSTLSFPTFEFSTTTVRVAGVVGFAEVQPPLTGNPAWTLPASSSSSSGTPGLGGIEFSVRTPSDVTALGFYDDTFSSPVGLASSHQLGVFDATTQALLVLATVPAGTVAPEIGRFRYVTCNRIRLIPGKRYVLAYLDGGDPTDVVPPQNFNRLPGVTLHAWRVGSTPLSFPNFIIPTPNFPAAGGLLLASRCPVDFDASGAPNPQDIFDFLNAWFAAAPEADFNAAGGITPQDIFDFLNAWFTGC